MEGGKCVFVGVKRCASSDTYCEITMTVLFFLPGATGPIHFFSLQKATDWRPNISFFLHLSCHLNFFFFLPYLSPFVLCVWLTQGWSTVRWQGRDASTLLTPHVLQIKKKEKRCLVSASGPPAVMFSAFYSPKKQMFAWLQTSHYVGDRGHVGSSQVTHAVMMAQHKLAVFLTALGLIIEGFALQWGMRLLSRIPE